MLKRETEIEMAVTDYSKRHIEGMKAMRKN
jgi:hypothetical protein